MSEATDVVVIVVVLLLTLFAYITLKRTLVSVGVGADVPAAAAAAARVRPAASRCPAAAVPSVHGISGPPLHPCTLFHVAPAQNHRKTPRYCRKMQ